MPEAKPSMNSFLQAAPWVAAAGLAGGLSARGLRHGFDMLRYGNTDGTPIDIDTVPASVAELPVTVTKEEAEELRRKGVKVKRKVIHKAAAVDLGNARWNLGFWSSLPAGALGAGALVGGWKLGDMGLDALRMHFAKDKKKKVEERISRILKDNPDDQDVPLHATMKAAEDAYFAKKASFMGVENPSYPLQNYASALGLLLGAGGTLAGLSAYNTVSSQNKYNEKSKALRAYLRNQAARTPRAIMDPVEEVEAAPKAA